MRPDLTINRAGQAWSIVPHTQRAYTFLENEFALRRTRGDLTTIDLDIIREWAETFGFVILNHAA